MHKIWNIHRPLSRINCVEVGHEGVAFTQGLPVQRTLSRYMVQLRDMQNGYEDEVYVTEECVADGRVHEAKMRSYKRLQKRSHGTFDTFVRFNALTGRLPFGELVYELIIPGGVWYRPGDVKRSPWVQAGPSYSYSKDQLFLLQTGDRVIFGSSTRVGERVATLVCHRDSLVLRFPTATELKIFWDEQKLWSEAWEKAQDIYNPHR